MATDRADVAVTYGPPDPNTADMTVTEWVADLSLPGSSADPTRTTHRPASVAPSQMAARRATGHSVSERSDTPDVVGLDLIDAHRLARRHRLRLSVSVWETKIGPWGMVLSQQPGGGRPPSGACIDVIVAARPHLAIPDVGGLEAGQAMRALRRFGLLPTRVEGRASRTIPAGHVIATRPRAGTLVVDGERVTVTISRAR